MDKIIKELKRCKIGYFDFSELKSLGISAIKDKSIRCKKIMVDDENMVCIKISYNENLKRVQYEYAIYNNNTKQYNNCVHIGYVNCDDALNYTINRGYELFNVVMSDYLKHNLNIVNVRVVDYLHY